MKNWLKNVWQVAVVGIGGFMCMQLYEVRSELSAFRAGTETELHNIDKRLEKIETSSSTAYERFNDKHSALNNKLTELEAKVSASLGK